MAVEREAVEREAVKREAAERDAADRAAIDGAAAERDEHERRSAPSATSATNNSSIAYSLPGQREHLQLLLVEVLQHTTSSV